MKRFVAQLNDGGYINIPAESMSLDDVYIKVYHNGELVAFLDVSVVLCAHVSEKEENCNVNKNTLEKSRV